MNATDPLSITVTAPTPTPAAALPAPAPGQSWLTASGPEACPQGWMPGKAVATAEEMTAAANPLHYVPVVGMIYRAITGESIPTPLKIGGAVVASAIAGGPLGALGAVFLGLAEELVRLGPDQSRPALPEGFSVNGSEGGMSPVTPGTITNPGGYTTLATTIPDFLTRPSMETQMAEAARRGVAAYEWQRSAMVERGVS